MCQTSLDIAKFYIRDYIVKKPWSCLILRFSASVAYTFVNTYIINDYNKKKFHKNKMSSLWNKPRSTLHFHTLKISFFSRSLKRHKKLSCHLHRHGWLEINFKSVCGAAEQKLGKLTNLKISHCEANSCMK